MCQNSRIQPQIRHPRPQYFPGIKESSRQPGSEYPSKELHVSSLKLPAQGFALAFHFVKMASMKSLLRRITTNSKSNTDEHNTQPYPNASLPGLGTDLLLMIVDLLPASDIKSLCLVNSSFNKSARYGLHQSIRLEFLDEDFHHLKQRLSRLGLSSTANPVDKNFRKAQQRLAPLEKERLFPAVRRLQVSGISRRATRIENVHGKNRAWEKGELDKRLDLLCRAIPLMTGLKHLVWHGPAVPEEVLTTLRGCPEVKLSVIARDSHEYSPLQKLVSCQNLYALDIQHCYVRAEECRLVTKPLREILLTCPNLRKLRLDISLPRSGCVAHCTPPEYHGIGFRNGEKPPPLEELIIDDYPFGSNHAGYPQADIWVGNCRGYPADVDEIPYWIERFDWSKLRKLGGRRSHFALLLMPKLSASPLEEINIGWAGREDERSAFMSLPTTLKAIKADSFDEISLEGITRQGATLQRLIVHHAERYDKAWNDEAINHSTLREIRDLCPNISELELDIARDGDWPYTTLDLLASFPRLRTLTLWFELGITDNQNPIKHYLTFSTAAHLFTHLHTLNPRIRNLVLHSGAPPGFGLGYPGPGAFWPEENSATFECKLSSRDDEAPQGIFTTTCLNLGKAENNMLRSLLAQYPEGGVALGDGVKEIEKYWKGLTSQRACKIAWEGPIPMARYDYDLVGSGMRPLADDDDPDL